MRGFLVLAMLALGGGASAGEVYQWVENGKVHYGDRPKHEAKPMKLKPLSGLTPPPVKEPVSEEQAQRAAECAAKQKLLAAYKDAPTITETDSLGNARDFTEEQRQQLIAKTEQLVQEACGAPAPVAP